MRNKKEDLVGTIIEINGTKYLIDRVFEVEKEFNSERAVEQPRLSLTLIEIKSEKKAINLVINSEVEKPFKMKGFTIIVKEGLLKNVNQKLVFIRVLKTILYIGLKEAKDLVDNADLISNARYVMHYEIIYLVKSEAETYIRKIHAELCQSLSCKSDDITISIY